MTAASLPALPDGYQPFPTLGLCGNKLLRGTLLVDSQGRAPFFVGQGPAPLLWLQAPGKTKGGDFVALVAASKSLVPDIRVESSLGAVEVFCKDRRILHLLSPSADVAIIDEIDLRPVGIELAGTSAGLVAKGVRMNGATISSGTFRLNLTD